MTLNRRNFLRTSLSGAAITLGAPAFAACVSKAAPDESAGNIKKGQGAKNKAVLNISFQEGVAPGKTLKEKLDFMEKNGIVGFEPGGNGLGARVSEIKNALKGRNIKVSAICAGFKGFILSTDPAIRKQCMDTMKEIITAAGELGSVGVIIVPAFNAQVPVMPHTMETRNFLCEQFNEMGTFAAEHGTAVIFEPLNRKECFYMRQVADAASVCRDINNPGVRCMKDAVEAFAAAVSKRNDLGRPEVQRLLRLKLQSINELCKQIKKLREDIHTQRETRKGFAKEYYLMGNECITKARDLNAAVRSFDKALKLDPDYVDAWVGKGVTLYDLGDCFQAITCLNEAVRLNSKSFKARYNRGKCYLSIKYHEEAVADFIKALDVKPKHIAAHEYLAEAFRGIGEDELARQHQEIADQLREDKNL